MDQTFPFFTKVNAVWSIITNERSPSSRLCAHVFRLKRCKPRPYSCKVFHAMGPSMKGGSSKKNSNFLSSIQISTRSRSMTWYRTRSGCGVLQLTAEPGLIWFAAAEAGNETITCLCAVQVYGQVQWTIFSQYDCVWASAINYERTTLSDCIQVFGQVQLTIL